MMHFCNQTSSTCTFQIQQWHRLPSLTGKNPLGPPYRAYSHRLRNVRVPNLGTRTNKDDEKWRGMKAPKSLRCATSTRILIVAASCCRCSRITPRPTPATPWRYSVFLCAAASVVLPAPRPRNTPHIHKLRKRSRSHPAIDTSWMKDFMLRIRL